MPGIQKETSYFCSYYFELHVQSKITRVGQNDNKGEKSIESTLSIFNQCGHAVGGCKD